MNSNPDTALESKGPASLAITMPTRGTMIELTGPSGYVTQYLGELRALGALDAAYFAPRAHTANASGGDAGKRAADGGIDSLLERFFAGHGRRHVGDLILIFGYYITEIQRRLHFSAEDLEFHFAHSGVRPPLSLANALGTLKRKQGFIAPGDKRGTYVLTSAGRREIQHRLARTGT